MIFFLLLAVASATTAPTTSFAQNHTATCGTLDPAASYALYVDGCVAQTFFTASGNLVNPPATMSMAGDDLYELTGTQVASMYAFCSLYMNDDLNAPTGATEMWSAESAVYECECDNTEGCEWAQASQVTVATSVCLQDPACMTSWAAIQTASEKEGVTYDRVLSTTEMYFPSATANTNADFCVILQESMTEANVKAMALGTALFATGMATGAGDAAVAECNDIIMETIQAVAGKAILTMSMAAGFGFSFMTLITVCVYFKFCKKKD